MPAMRFSSVGRMLKATARPPMPRPAATLYTGRPRSWAPVARMITPPISAVVFAATRMIGFRTESASALACINRSATAITSHQKATAADRSAAEVSTMSSTAQNSPETFTS